MVVNFQLVIDCTDPDRLARFWATALGYQLEPPPAGFATWDDYWRDVGVPEDDLGIGEDRIAEARRLADLGATMVGVLQEEGIDHYGVAMKDPEDNEFDIN
jgi:glyoxalase superfamily protein